ncbi:hypothetical protein [Haliangium ochraceum]|uniref:Outer membrane protein beta-barrel domain-containing protein n=1 Tax=Haliangium ochraceum (strain DSM 14365 / JCM 11303 / SMP-2) TaxID=502025 RepID=D0LKI2_HALO1|nr:hypothetical protein [Haliangium ochraceum]ACY15030.1 hypothetical protein Hoch_2494 [Haliangium ochraceum DSM 14365]
MKSLFFAAAMTLALALVHGGTAHAQGQFGVGAQSMLTGPGNPGTVTGGLSAAALTYDAGQFHIDGLFHLSAGGDTHFGLGAQFWYGLHAGDRADFSVGGGFGVVDDGNDGNDDDTDFHLDLGVKMRVFLTGNVALSAVLGLGFVLDDEEDDNDDDFFIGGQNTTRLGITYFF